MRFGLDNDIHVETVCLPSIEVKLIMSELD